MRGIKHDNIEALRLGLKELHLTTLVPEQRSEIASAALALANTLIPPLLYFLWLDEAAWAKHRPSLFPGANLVTSLYHETRFREGVADLCKGL